MSRRAAMCGSTRSCLIEMRIFDGSAVRCSGKCCVRRSNDLKLRWSLMLSVRESAFTSKPVHDAFTGAGMNDVSGPLTTGFVFFSMW